MRKRIFAPLATVAAATVAVIPSTAAHADPATNDTPQASYLINRGDDTCATVRGTDDATASLPVGVDRCGTDESTGQSWYWDEGRLLAAATGRYLQVPADRDEAGATLGAGVYDDGLDQYWDYDPESGRLSPSDAPDLAVTAGESLTVRDWTGEPEQRWDFADTMPAPVAATSAVPSAPPASSDDSLPVTGAGTTGYLVAGASAALLGGLVLAVVRGRRRLLRGANYW